MKQTETLTKAQQRKRDLASGLSKLKKLFKHLGNPQDRLSVIHVAWTNGKWSVTNMIAQVLHTQGGYTVWLFTSPHLLSIHERIRINNKNISDEKRDEYLWKATRLQEEFKIKLSFFEVTFLASICCFIDKKVDYAVIEVWLGWTLDATNVFKKPVATAITSIWFDHVHILWKTTSQIQRNKMWIMKQWVPCYTWLDNKLMYYWARCKGATLKICTKQIQTNLPGDHQEKNAWIAYEILQDIWISKTKIRTWLMHITHRWRCERLRENLLIDGAHNESWLIALNSYVETRRPAYTKIITVFWTVKDLNMYRSRLQEHLIQWDENYLIQIDSKRALPIRSLPMPFDVQYLDESKFFKETLYTQDPRYLYIVYGSLHLMGEIIALFDE